MAVLQVGSKRLPRTAQDVEWSLTFRLVDATFSKRWLRRTRWVISGSRLLPTYRTAIL